MPVSPTTLLHPAPNTRLHWLRMAPQLIPPLLLNTLIEHTLNRTFQSALHAGQLDFLLRKSVQICVNDLDFNLIISVQNRSLVTRTSGLVADVTLKSDARSLLEIVTGKVDPDTLFFRRKLAIEGDTELGLALKNFLDTCEPQQLLPSRVYRLLQRLTASRSAPHEPSE